MRTLDQIGQDHLKAEALHDLDSVVGGTVEDNAASCDRSQFKTIGGGNWMRISHGCFHNVNRGNP